ncbi:GntR family transcriptional regulator [Lysinibacillus sp. SGAir0095]|uniref:GntR family transcriptional regulator n=1 Tax=Lysinibacillus sp. SGAir0095 TaxID=2070463 RepID=UPI0010CD272C|nr:GntR family transcriptional regulator [Lysinibacillus sp. SGAir0095]QCR33085.1 GntR family transcriptional regulator [Lysinibacillus sp. SGAir0095]
MVSDKKNAQKYAYEYIRDRMLDGSFKGGMKIVEERLADEIGVSRTPIREAIRRLEQEGLIKKKHVYNPTIEDLKYLYEMRILLESFAAEKAAKNMTSEKLKELGNTIKQSRKGQSESIYNANQLFHDLIVDECNNPSMIHILEKARTIFYLFSLKLDIYKRPHLIDEHEEIYMAIKDRNEQLAGELMAKHLYNDMNYTLAEISSKKE